MNHALALIGYSGRFPQSDSLDTFWHAIIEGANLISFFEEAELDAEERTLFSNASHFVNAKGILKGIDQFDASLFGYSVREAECMDPQQRIFLECSWEALEHAGYLSDHPEELIGVFASSSLSTYLIFNLLPYLQRTRETTQNETLMLMGADKDFLATKVSFKLDLRGPSKTIQTACSSSLVAVHDACQSLLNYECDIALAGGVSVTCPEKHGYFYTPDGINSPDGCCRPFDATAKGTVIGNGAGVVILKRLEEALEDNDTIHAVILGSAVNNDGNRKMGYTAPSVEGQAEVIRAALEAAGATPQSIDYIETHGTGTQLGDPIEIGALTRAFMSDHDVAPARKSIAIGALKANIGHLDAAAGVAGLLKTILCFKHRMFPPVAHFQEPNPELALESSPFFIPKTAQKWTASSPPKRAGVSSFGIGGTNSHVIVEEFITERKPEGLKGSLLFPFSAHTETALQALIDRFRSFLALGKVKLLDMSFTLHTGRKQLEKRVCWTASTQEELLAKLESEWTYQTVQSESSPSLLFEFLKPEQFSRKAFSHLQAEIPSLKRLGPKADPQATYQVQWALVRLLQQLGLSPHMYCGSAEEALEHAHGMEEILSAPTPSQFYTKEMLASEKTSFISFSCASRAAVEHFFHCPLLDRETLLHAVGEAWKAGYPLRWPKLLNPQPCGRVPLPTYTFERQSYWIPAPVAMQRKQEPQQITVEAATDDPIVNYLMGLWKQALKAPTVEPASNFFEVGGDSLIALEITDHLRDQFSVELHIQTFFETPTLEQHAHIVREMLECNLKSMEESKAEKILKTLNL